MSNFYRFPNGDVYELSHKPSDATQISKAAFEREQRANAVKELRKLLKPGDTVYCVLKHRSASGMMRSIDFVIADKAKRVFSIAYLIGRANGAKMDQERGGLRIGGCGMDMGFSVVYGLGSTLWPKGTPKPHGTRNGEPDSAGGYALKHQWL